MNEWETCIDEWATRCRELQAAVEALQAQLVQEQALNTVRRDAWWQSVKELEAALDAEREKVKALQRERDELQSVFDLGHTRTVEADKLWQEAHGQPEVWPDLGELVGWLMKRHDDVRAELEALRDEREKVRTVEHELARIVKRNQGGYIGDRIAIDKCLTIIRTLDATTPAGGQG